MIPEEIESWASEIADDMKKQYGLSVHNATPIDKGWLNVKWKMETDQGPVFVKFYHPARYKLHLHPERKAAIRKTLELQHGLHSAGVRCPGVHQQNNRFLQETSTGLHYAVLDWVDGYTMPAGSLSEAQMFDLGQNIGNMHKWLRSVQPMDNPAWKPDKEGYFKDWQGNWKKAQEANDEIVLEWLTRSRQFVESLDFQMFDACPVGWLHWDLWVDNILVNEHGLAGIVDFDRMAVAYPEIDVARAILSGSLRDGQLRTDTVASFVEGYREYLELSKGIVVRAISMLYLIESIWWLRTEVRAESNLRGLLGRFIEEMHWIEDHWETLQEQLDCI